jgi:hypothetical protein
MTLVLEEEDVVGGLDAAVGVVAEDDGGEFAEGGERDAVLRRLCAAVMARVGEVDEDVVEGIAGRVDRGFEHEAVEDRLGDGGELQVVGHGEGGVEAGLLLLFALLEAALVEDAEDRLEDDVVRVHELVEVGEVGGDEGVGRVVPEAAFVELFEVEAPEDGFEAGALAELGLEDVAFELAEDAVAVEGFAGAGAGDEELVAAGEEGEGRLLEELGAAGERFGDVKEGALEGFDGAGHVERFAVVDVGPPIGGGEQADVAHRATWRAGRPLVHTIHQIGSVYRTGQACRVALTAGFGMLRLLFR